jgi:hypothetical protein
MARLGDATAQHTNDASGTQKSKTAGTKSTGAEKTKPLKKSELEAQVAELQGLHNRSWS